jgi:integrase
MKRTTVNFTKSVLSGIEAPPKDSKRVIYRDAYQKGLVLMVTYGGTKTFYFSCRINRRKKLLKIGQFPYTSIDNAREKAFLLNKDIKNNINPLEVQQKTKIITLDDFFNNEYVPKYANIYKKESSCKENKRIFKRHFKDFKNRTMQSITRNEIDTLHKAVGQNSGIYLANRCLALIRHIFNIAIQFEFLNMNPASKIKMYPEKSRDRFLQPSEMTAFMNALESSKNTQLKNLILLLLYTGQRKMRVKTLSGDFIYPKLFQ